MTDTETTTVPDGSRSPSWAWLTLAMLAAFGSAGWSDDVAHAMRLHTTVPLGWEALAEKAAYAVVFVAAIVHGRRSNSCLVALAWIAALFGGMALVDILMDPHTSHVPVPVAAGTVLVLTVVSSFAFVRAVRDPDPERNPTRPLVAWLVGAPAPLMVLLGLAVGWFTTH